MLNYILILYLYLYLYQKKKKIECIKKYYMSQTDKDYNLLRVTIVCNNNNYYFLYHRARFQLIRYLSINKNMHM